jgi:hypothetical protein
MVITETKGYEKEEKKTGGQQENSRNHSCGTASQEYITSGYRLIPRVLFILRSQPIMQGHAGSDQDRITIYVSTVLTCLLLTFTPLYRALPWRSGLLTSSD